MTNCYEFSVGGSEYEHLTLKKCSPPSSTFRSLPPFAGTSVNPSQPLATGHGFHQAGYQPEMAPKFTTPVAADGEFRKRRDLPCRESVRWLKKGRECCPWGPEGLRLSPLLEACLAGLRTKLEKVHLRDPPLALVILKKVLPDSSGPLDPVTGWCSPVIKKESLHKSEIDPHKKPH